MANEETIKQLEYWMSSNQYKHPTKERREELINYINNTIENIPQEELQKTREEFNGILSTIKRNKIKDFLRLLITGHILRNKFLRKDSHTLK